MSPEQLFKSLFKFEVGQQVRHKADTKDHVSDMGLLILNRYMIESISDDDQRIYDRGYTCRMIRFSGSGDSANFKEKELLSIEDYNKAVIKEESERNALREQSRQVQQEIYTAFGVNRDSEVYLVKDGKPDESAIYKVSGFSRMQAETKLTLRKVAGLGSHDNEKAEVTSKDEFVLVK